MLQNRNHFGALARIFVALIAFASCGPENTSPEKVEKRPNPLIIVGVDGATWDVIDPMISNGELANFQALIERGSRADLLGLPPLSSPVVWTTFATGRFPRDHNILDHTQPYVDGVKQRPVASTMRRVPALWNIASHYSRSVTVVSYFATHPAEVVNGFMISSSAFQGLPGSVYPPELDEELVQNERRQLSEKAEMDRVVGQYIGWDFNQDAIDNPQDPYQMANRVAMNRLTRQPLHDEFVRRLTLRLLDRPTDLLMTYLRMPDHTSHATWLYYDDTSFEEKADPTVKKLLENAIPESYRIFDRFLGGIVAGMPDNANLIILSDHGFGPATGIWSVSRPEHAHLTGNHRPDGIFLAAGPDIAQGKRLNPINIFDIAPIFLKLLDVPISEELPGRLEPELFRSEYLDEFPRVSTSSYRMRWQSLSPVDDNKASLIAEADKEALQTLEALGYIKNSSGGEQGSTDDEIDFWDVAPRLLNRALVGEMMFYILREDTQSLDELLAMARKSNPRSALDLLNITTSRMDQWQDYFEPTLFNEDIKEMITEKRLQEHGALHQSKTTSN